MKPTAVNVITGFPGVGKTTAILNLLQQKPDDELWAILVNEFGEIGVDGGLLKGQAPVRDDVMVFEIPGGCMCCAAGLPMEMALSQLFFLASPDRLIIEPTGLGHPAEVLSVLASDAYRDRLPQGHRHSVSQRGPNQEFPHPRGRIDLGYRRSVRVIYSNFFQVVSGLGLG